MANWENSPEPLSGPEVVSVSALVVHRYKTDANGVILECACGWRRNPAGDVPTIIQWLSHLPKYGAFNLSDADQLWLRDLNQAYDRNAVPDPSWLRDIERGE